MSRPGCLWADRFPNRSEQLPSLCHQHSISNVAAAGGGSSSAPASAAQEQLLAMRVWAVSPRTSSVGLFFKKIKLFSRKPRCCWWFHLIESEAETSGPAWS